MARSIKTLLPAIKSEPVYRTALDAATEKNITAIQHLRKNVQNLLFMYSLQIRQGLTGELGIPSVGPNLITGDEKLFPGNPLCMFDIAWAKEAPGDVLADLFSVKNLVGGNRKTAEMKENMVFVKNNPPNKREGSSSRDVEYEDDRVTPERPEDAEEDFDSEEDLQFL